MSENNTDREFIQKIPEGFPISSDYFNDVFDDVEDIIKEFDSRIIGPWKGEWKETEPYKQYEIVQGFDGNLYVARVDNEDRDPVTDTEDYQERQYWDLFLEVGIKWRDWWEEDETYYVNDVVRANDNNLYIAKSKNTDVEPTEDENDVWEIFLLGADNTDASSIQGNAFSQQDPREDEGFRWNEDTKQFDLVPLYDKQEVHSVSFQQALLFGDYSNQNSPFSTFSFDISEPEDGQTFIYNEETDMFELKQTVTSSEIKSIKVVDEEPSDPEDDVLYIISGDSIQLNGDILINSA